MQSFPGCMPALQSPAASDINVHRYYIPRYVHFASEGDVTVFLNIRADQYSMLFGENARRFHSALRVGTDSIQEITLLDTPPNGNQELCQGLLSELLQYHLLTDKRGDAASARGDIALPKEDLLDTSESETLRVGLRDIWRFFLSCLLATWSLKFARLETTISLLERRKALKTPARPANLSTVRGLLGLYNGLRPFFPRDYLCLFDSLSLVEFLARYRCYPDMIFAVKLDPWGAHCWVQWGTVALNQDSHDAQGYLPIMAI